MGEGSLLKSIVITNANMVKGIFRNTPGALASLWRAQLNFGIRRMLSTPMGGFLF